LALQSISEDGLFRNDPLFPLQLGLEDILGQVQVVHIPEQVQAHSQDSLEQQEEQNLEAGHIQVERHSQVLVHKREEEQNLVRSLQVLHMAFPQLVVRKLEAQQLYNFGIHYICNTDTTIVLDCSTFADDRRRKYRR
jgi:hypothetical protein